MPAATRSLPAADRYIAAERNAGAVRVGRVSKEFSGEASVADNGLRISDLAAGSEYAITDTIIGQC